MERQWIFVDADDTLWENNVYFEEAIERFVKLLNHSQLSPQQVRGILDEIEQANVRRQGYGSLSFARNLEECFRRLAERPHCGEELARVRRLGHAILDRSIELIEGVEETLEQLSARHHLTLFTKGHPEEQHGKFERSGLRGYFHGCRIVAEKSPDAYRSLTEELGADPALSWMVGNSPKSDIKPALAAGLGAVWVPHPQTWSLEHDELPEPSGRFRVIESFRQLAGLF